MELAGVFQMRRRVLVYLIVLVSLVLSVMALAGPSSAVNVGGDLEGEHIWRSSAGPYHVVDDVRVMDGASLRILAGVEVVFTGAFTITCEGDANITASGTEEDRISFDSLRPVDYRYGYIETGRSGTFSNCSFMNADKPKRPNEEIKIARIVLIKNIFSVTFCNCSLRKEKSL